MLWLRVMGLHENLRLLPYATLVSFQGYFESIYTMLGDASYDMGAWCMDDPWLCCD